MCTLGFIMYALEKNNSVFFSFCINKEKTVKILFLILVINFCWCALSVWRFALLLHSKKALVPIPAESIHREVSMFSLWSFFGLYGFPRSPKIYFIGWLMTLNCPSGVSIRPGIGLSTCSGCTLPAPWSI